jgi:hypothetical protein
VPSSPMNFRYRIGGDVLIARRGHLCGRQAGCPHNWNSVCIWLRALPRGIFPDAGYRCLRSSTTSPAPRLPVFRGCRGMLDRTRKNV